jgi:2-polyprenyl-3-methyl-5-hydroxy-6-metoxy-1,4-benzoquinol methylase
MHCPACKEEFDENFYQIDQYNCCNNCGSYIFLSKKTAEQYNEEFYGNFNQIKNQLNVIDKKKYKIFEFIYNLDRVIRRVEFRKFKRIRQKIYNICNERKHKILEVGFGTGEHLYSLLSSGIDAYGIDISVDLVNNFKEKYPDFADRVIVETRLNQKIDIIYCSALFEHLDNVNNFINELDENLKPGGCLIIANLPIVNNSKSNIKKENDIAFWDGIHKAIYSLEGLKKLFDEYNYKIEEICSFDDYNYRILSSHLEMGYSDIVNIRHPFGKNKALPNICTFLVIAIKSLFKKSLGLNSMLIIKKSIL